MKSKRQAFDALLHLPKPYAYELPPPNESVNTLYDLCFGRGWYEDIRYKRTAVNEKYWVENDNGNYWLRHDWRTLLSPSDPWALMYIWQDCEGKFLLESKERYLTLTVFDPDLLESMLIRHPKIIGLVRDVVKAGYASHSLKPLMSFLLRFFRTDYRKAYELAEAERYINFPLHRDTEARIYKPHTFEDKFQQACKQFDKAADLVARFLTRHYGLYPETWVAMLAAHADMSDYWKYFTSQTLKEPVKHPTYLKKERKP